MRYTIATFDGIVQSILWNGTLVQRHGRGNENRALYRHLAPAPLPGLVWWATHDRRVRYLSWIRLWAALPLLSPAQERHPLRLGHPGLLWRPSPSLNVSQRALGPWPAWTQRVSPRRVPCPHRQSIGPNFVEPFRRTFSGKPPMTLAAIALWSDQSYPWSDFVRSASQICESGLLARNLKSICNT